MELAAAAAIGLVSGIASGMFGIGGAVLSTPGIRLLLSAPANIAVGTTLPVIVPTALTGARNYLKGGWVDRRLALFTASAGIPASVLGARTTEWIPGAVLMILSAALVLALALRMLSGGGSDAGRTNEVSAVAMLSVGAVSGFLSGLLGVGGGLVLVPVYTAVFGLSVKAAIGTSLAVVAAQAIPGSVVHALQGNIDARIALGLLVGTVPGASLGSRWAVKAKDSTLRLLVVVGLSALSVAWGISEFRSL